MDFLENILTESGYKRECNDLNLWGKEFEFFTLKKIEESDFSGFYNNDELNQFVTKFQSIENEKVKKNTSMFILVEVSNLENFYRKNLNQIMQIEEDQYYFRKYVIAYTESGINNLRPYATSLINYIQGVTKRNQSLFGMFEKDMFFLDEYFIAMQLIIKMPFISLPPATEHFELIEDRIKATITNDNMIEKEKELNSILEILNCDDIKRALEDEETLRKLCSVLGDEDFEA